MQLSTTKTIQTRALTLSGRPRGFALKIDLESWPSLPDGPLGFGWVPIALSEPSYLAAITSGQVVLGLAFFAQSPTLPYQIDREKKRWGMLSSRVHARFADNQRSVQARLEQLTSGQISALRLALVAPTRFQWSSYQALLSVGFGEVVSYQDLAKASGSPKAVRAIGRINATNPLPWLLPCHRVCAADGGLGGYGFGLKNKQYLLSNEAEAQRQVA